MFNNPFGNSTHLKQCFWFYLLFHKYCYFRQTVDTIEQLLTEKMNNPILIELKQKDFELEMKDKIIKEQKIELEQQQTLISSLKDELQQLKIETDIKQELQEKMIEKLKIELEVYVTEIKKKMNGWKKKQESHSDNPIQRNSKTTSPVEMPSNQENMQTNVTPKLEIKINQEELSKFPISTMLLPELPKSVKIENEMLVQSAETISEVKIVKEFRQNEEVAQLNSSPMDISNNEATIANVPIKKGKTFECKSCLKLFACNNQMKKHIKMVHDKLKPFKCNICSCAFGHYSALKKHTDSVHKKIKPFKCNICSCAFGYYSSLKKHTDSVHNNLRPSECNICTKAFTTNTDLKRHIDTVHEKLKPFSCHICFFTFGQTGQLNRHINFVHKNLRPFQCDICDAAFQDKRCLKRHTDTVHLNLKTFG